MLRIKNEAGDELMIIEDDGNEIIKDAKLKEQLDADKKTAEGK